MRTRIKCNNKGVVTNRIMTQWYNIIKLVVTLYIEFAHYLNRNNNTTYLINPKERSVNTFWPKLRKQKVIIYNYI